MMNNIGIDKNLFSPMMRQYLEIKENYPDALLLFRLGDFYELFFEDAKTVSKELDLYLTGRDAGVDERVPMCGVPHHAVNNYISKLIAKGYKVAIAEQMEDPAMTKGLVKREVVQLLTPGTLIDVGLNEKENNYIAALDESFLEFTLSYADISTGEIFVLSLDKDISILISELDSLHIKEIVISTAFSSLTKAELLEKRNYLFSYEDMVEQQEIGKRLLAGIKDIHQITIINRLVNYLQNSQKRNLEYLKAASVIITNKYLQMDNYTRNNLELTRTLNSGETYGSLLWLINKTKTAIGSRLLKKWILRPLNNQTEIEKRLNIVEELTKNYQLRVELERQLTEIYDLERIIGRISFGNTNGRDLLQLKKSIEAGGQLDKIVKEANNPVVQALGLKMASLDQVALIIEKAIVENPPLTIKEGGIFKEGYSKELDRLRTVSGKSKEYLTLLENQEREKTGIKNLKVSYNRVFGFYIEVTKAYINDVKEEYGYQRIQTLTNCERYKTIELKEKEDEILNAESRILQFEYELFLNLRELVKLETVKIQKMADFIALIDVYYAFAAVSLENDYIRPIFNNKHIVDIAEGRHPIIEKFSTVRYVSNDWKMAEDTSILVITGPNMGGKSTYMRQQALIVIMAQIGCFVPARKALLPIFNKIFTRIGASDDLISGQSTFMVEMSEANNALRYADEHSLVIFDEIGRGTSTYDGMALAQAIIEYIAFHNKCKTLFSTHYHQLTTISDRISGIKNISVMIEQKKDDILFLYKIIEEPANRSYGINVASLAGLPRGVLARASELLKLFESEGHQFNAPPAQFEYQEKKEVHPVVEELKKMDVNNITPLSALEILHQIKRKLEDED